MATLYLYYYQKKVNSTKRPALTDTRLTITGEFKSPCSVSTPVIIIEVPTGSNLFTGFYNYAYITDVTRYYWIDDIVMISGKLAELHLRVDVLATYRTAIGSSTQFVSRAAAETDDYITDAFYPVSNKSMRSIETVSLDWDMLLPGQITQGFYVLGIINQSLAAVGPVSYYVMDQSGFATFRYRLLSSTSYTNMSFTDISEELYKSLFNPFQYIVSCVWFPIKPPVAEIGDGYIHFGFFKVAYSSGHTWLLSNTTVSSFTGGALNTVNHPQVSEAEYFMFAPYTKRRLLVQPFGEIDLDCSKITDVNHVLKIYSWLDWTTGDVMLRVINTAESNAVCGEGSGKLGVPIAMAQVSQNVLGAVRGYTQYSAGAVQTATGVAQMALTGGLVGANQMASGVQNSVNGLTSAMEAYAPKVSTAGVNGSLMNTVVPATYEVQFFYGPTPEIAKFGGPLCKAKQISTLNSNGGYIKCEHARLTTNAGAYAPEIEAVEAYMNSGFFYE